MKLSGQVLRKKNPSFVHRLLLHSQKKGGFQRFWQRTLGFLNALRFFKEPWGSLEYPIGFFEGTLKNL